MNLWIIVALGMLGMVLGAALVEIVQHFERRAISALRRTWVACMGLVDEGVIPFRVVDIKDYLEVRDQSLPTSAIVRSLDRLRDMELISSEAIIKGSEVVSRRYYNLGRHHRKEAR